MNYETIVNTHIYLNNQIRIAHGVSEEEEKEEGLQVDSEGYSLFHFENCLH